MLQIKDRERRGQAVVGVPRVKGTHSGPDWGARGELGPTDPDLFKPSSFQHHLILRPSENTNCVNRDLGLSFIQTEEE